MTALETLYAVVVFLLGFYSVLFTLYSAIRWLILPRNDNVMLISLIFIWVNRLFQIQVRRAKTYEERDNIMALFAPITLFIIPLVLLTLITLGYTAMFWAVDPNMDTYEAFRLSGSSILTLGFENQRDPIPTLLEFSEAAIGLVLIALIVAYLPSMYSAFSRRETLVTLLETRAGSPQSSLEMLLRLHRIEGLYNETIMEGIWSRWEEWFAEIDENHTTLAPLIFFRSPNPHRSWITAAGTILDCAALTVSTIDIQYKQPLPQMTIRSGYIALRHIVDFFGLDYNLAPKPTDPISIDRSEFDEVYDTLLAAGVPLKPDRDQCWRDYSGWRVNYDIPLLQLASMTMAPYSPWVSDRSMPNMMQRPTK